MTPMKGCIRLVRCLLPLAAAIIVYPAVAQDYVLSLEYETKSEGLVELASRSSSSGRQTLAERVITETQAGSEIEYSIPGPSDEIRGNAKWMFPVRVLVAPDGTKTILNQGDLSTRLDAWLSEAEWTREVCSRWLFTWTAIQVRCDPQAAIESVEAYGMRPGRVAEGEEITLVGVAGPVILEKAGTRDGHDLLVASGPIDPHFLREQEAQAALVIAEISGEDLTPEAAAAQIAGIDATGTVSVEFEIDDAGLVWRRTETNDLIVTGRERGGDETRWSVHTVTRNLRSAWDEQQQDR